MEDPRINVKHFWAPGLSKDAMGIVGLYKTMYSLLGFHIILRKSSC